MHTDMVLSVGDIKAGIDAVHLNLKGGSYLLLADSVGLHSVELLADVDLALLQIIKPTVDLVNGGSDGAQML